MRRVRVWRMWWLRMMPLLGFGIGWRPELALAIERRDALSFVEVTAESIRLDDIPPALTRMVAQGVPVIVHGLSLSLGGAERPDPRRLDHLVRVAERLGARLVSEHLAFVRAEGLEAGHLLPVPRTREALEVIVENVAWAKRMLPLPLALENIATLVEWPGVAMDEASFLAEILERTDTGLLFDVSNMYANARNGQWDPVMALARLPLGRLAYVHVAGGTVRDDLYHDTHAHPVGEGPLALLEELCSRIAPPGVMLERDDHFPRESALEAELEAIRMAVARGATRRIGNPN
ncbi:MAG TPA: DUF692 domain-containing protein [Solirubrobacteraceae bacterium]|nr:DUF692 domain-containing protein [Solirubrobacteraceae bacterium]